jgi:hypothetical protein
MTQTALRYGLQPLLMPAEVAHQRGWVTYLSDGTAVVRHPELQAVGAPSEVHVAPKRQYPAIRATFDDLNKALSRLANSPLADGQRTLRQLYDQEVARYEAAVLESAERGALEPDYGTYVFDHHAEHLYLVAPEYWHRLGLVTSNSMLTTDPLGRLTWREIREKLEHAVVGFAGVSVGGNLLEGWLREARPRQVKIADPDWLELTNFNRCERASLRHLVASRAARFDPLNAYDVPRVSKAEFAAYEQNLVDPYVEFFTYKEPLSSRNIAQFLLGDGKGEPPIDILVEEVDDLDVKLLLRDEAKRCRIDVLMVTDFGHRTHLLWNPFSTQGDAPMGTGGNDDRLRAALTSIKQGKREALFQFINEMCGVSYHGDPFERFVNAEGEQPTASLPQSGSTTMLAGGLGGKELALRVLGHDRASSTRAVVFDYLQRSVQFA